MFGPDRRAEHHWAMVVGFLVFYANRSICEEVLVALNMGHDAESSKFYLLYKKDVTLEYFHAVIAERLGMDSKA
jgi:hypothetical protein